VRCVGESLRAQSHTLITIADPPRQQPPKRPLNAPWRRVRHVGKVRRVGTFIYEIEDRMLAHLRAVITNKLHRSEPFIARYEQS
jgi:hypothetical protein